MNDNNYEAPEVAGNDQEVPVWQQILKLVAGIVLALILGAVLGRLFFYFTIEQPGRSLQENQEVGGQQWWESQVPEPEEAEPGGAGTGDSF